ncbi:hypothetical protein P154DRAFT_499000 [Amniculicola lignicola CBS 123094]|uniref:Sm domain-containing protein n=1 Tax=Amniculicola lignicola CBS 123094 TaxID=1392246 RepID=A0A6A5W2X6_9PLEO|nr:hypothetical protein P154DRAFT_499000 [Amniculicola lignicola CBS 123094]
MSYNSNAPPGAPAGPPQSMAANFNAMLSRSVQEPPPQEPFPEATSTPPPGMGGYGGVYNAPPQQPFGPGAGGPPQPAQILPSDLPPQAFLTSAMLLEMVDKKVDVLLRDEKEYIGILRSYDQFANLVLTECFERIVAHNPDAPEDSTPDVPGWVACDVRLPGVMTIRGENVTICATVDLDREDEPKGLKFIEEKEVRALAATQRAEKKATEDRKAKTLKRHGIEPNLGLLG